MLLVQLQAGRLPLGELFIRANSNVPDTVKILHVFLHDWTAFLLLLLTEVGGGSHIDCSWIFSQVVDAPPMASSRLPESLGPRPGLSLVNSRMSRSTSTILTIMTEGQHPADGGLEPKVAKVVYLPRFLQHCSWSRSQCQDAYCVKGRFFLVPWATGRTNTLYRILIYRGGGWLWSIHPQFVGLKLAPLASFPT